MEALPIPIQEAIEAEAKEIDKLLGRTVQAVAEIGRRLLRVYGYLNCSRPAFVTWLNVRYGWSESTARNYIAVARVVEKYPELLQATELTFVYEFSKWSKPIQEHLIENRILNRREAEPIVAKHRRQEWREAMEDYLLTGPPAKREIRLGDTLAWAQEALRDPVLKEEAEAFLRRHAQEFAEAAGEEWPDLLAQAGLRFSERHCLPAQLEMPRDPEVYAFWQEGSEGLAIVVVCDGARRTAAYFPSQTEEWARHWQRLAVAVIRRHLPQIRVREAPQD